MFLARTEDVSSRVERLGLPFNRHGVDPFGVSQKYLNRWLSMLSWFYRSYFRVTVSGLEHVPEGRGMLVGNHSGGIALDGAMVIASLFVEMEPPRLAHAMAEKFLSRVPFVGHWMTQSGQLCGVPEHAVQILEAERLLVVFPEGQRGTAKLYGARHTLVDFGTGFMRMALKTRTPIVPFAFLGAGEAIPTLFNLYKPARWFGMPYFPVTPYILPLPRRAKLDIYYSEPMLFEGTGDEDDAVIQGYVSEVKARIASLIEHGEKVREGRDSEVIR